MLGALTHRMVKLIGEGGSDGVPCVTIVSLVYVAKRNNCNVVALDGINSVNKINLPFSQAASLVFRSAARPMLSFGMTLFSM